MGKEGLRLGEGLDGITILKDVNAEIPGVDNII